MEKAFAETDNLKIQSNALDSDAKINFDHKQALSLGIHFEYKINDHYNINTKIEQFNELTMDFNFSLNSFQCSCESTAISIEAEKILFSCQKRFISNN